MNNPSYSYREKYVKYKKKYINLKDKLQGGAAMANESYQDLFDSNFEIFIQLIIDFNNDPTNVASGTLFHIKGGASVKAKALKYGKHHLGITNDIDILFINNHYEYTELISNPRNNQVTILQQNKQNATQKINDFLQSFRDRLPGVWTIEIDNNLHTIKYNNYGVFDITFYEHGDMSSDFIETIFGQAYNKVRTIQGLAITHDPKEYIESLLEFQSLGPSHLENYTFSDIDIEHHTAIIGRETYAKYIEYIPRWQQLAADPTLVTNKHGEIDDRKWQRYVYQSTPEYIQKIKNKFERYKVKLRIIDYILVIDSLGSDSE